MFNQIISSFVTNFILIAIVICFMVVYYFEPLHFSPFQRNEQANQIYSSECVIYSSSSALNGEQNDSCLIEIVRNKYLIPPSTLPYNLSYNEEMPSNVEKFGMLEKYIIDKNKPGFFIECGANDGQFISPTMRLERTYNWTGLLIEANPGPFSELRKTNRKAWLVNAALCITPFAEEVTFYTSSNESGLSGLSERADIGVNEKITVQCLPLYTILKALNISVVDYLSLDVEGLEVQILETIPFDEILFKFITVEQWATGRPEMQNFLESKGYFFVRDVQDNLTDDSAYVHESLLTTIWGKSN